MWFDVYLNICQMCDYVTIQRDKSVAGLWCTAVYEYSRATVQSKTKILRK